MMTKITYAVVERNLVGNANFLGKVLSRHRMEQVANHTYRSFLKGEWDHSRLRRMMYMRPARKTTVLRR